MALASKRWIDRTFSARVYINVSFNSSSLTSAKASSSQLSSIPSVPEIAVSRSWSRSVVPVVFVVFGDLLGSSSSLADENDQAEHHDLHDDADEWVEGSVLVLDTEESVLGLRHSHLVFDHARVVAPVLEHGVLQLQIGLSVLVDDEQVWVLDCLVIHKLFAFPFASIVLGFLEPPEFGRAPGDGFGLEAAVQLGVLALNYGVGLLPLLQLEQDLDLKLSELQFLIDVISPPMKYT